MRRKACFCVYSVFRTIETVVLNHQSRLIQYLKTQNYVYMRYKNIIYAPKFDKNTF